MAAPSHRAAEEKARQVLLRCERIDSTLRRLDQPVEFDPGEDDKDVKRVQESPHSSPSSSPSRGSKTDISSAEGSPTTPSELDDLRRATRQMQANAAIKYDKLEMECTSMKLELVNLKFELEQETLKLRRAENDKEELLKSLDSIVLSNEQTAATLRQENAEMARRMHALRAERDAALLENDYLKNSSQRGGFRRMAAACSLNRLKLGPGSVGGSTADNVSIETESVTSEPDECGQDVVELDTTSVSLSFKASTLN